MSDENKPKTSLSSLITGVIALLAAAIATHRTDTAAIAKQKADSDAKIAELEGKITELEGKEADVDALRPQLEDLLTQAQAAKPPSDEHVQLVENIAPATPPAASQTQEQGGSEQPQ